MSTANVPFREVPYLPQKLEVERCADGSILLRNGQPLKAFPDHALGPILHWAKHRPDTIWLAQRDPVDSSKPGWKTLTYGQAIRHIRAIAAGFIARGAGQNTPLMILSRNSIEHALIMYGALWAGVPVVPVTPAYATLATDFTRLNYIDNLIQPKFIFVEDGAEYQRGLDAMNIGSREIFFARNAPKGYMALPLEVISSNAEDPKIDVALARLTPKMTAKYMMTSGSTGEPKAVIHTHLMMASNAKMIRSVWDEERLDQLSGGPQVMINFLPWSHTYGANAILHNMTDWGSTLYIDWGAPTPARLPEMLRNLAEVSPTQHTTVPAAWAALATELERDDKLAETFFKRLIVMAYGGASMGQDIYERIQKVAVRITGERISLSAGYGATETAPTASNVHWPNDTMGLIGCPLPGVELKMTPAGEKKELRIRGPLVTPGYFRNETKTRDAFDEEGFYKLGDAVRFADPENPKMGLAFNGRLAEEFKLSNGSWVSAGTVRVAALAAVNGALSDLVICGLNQDYIGALGFLNLAFCQRLVGADLPLDVLAKDSRVIDVISEGIATYNKANPNAAARIQRLILQPDAPRAALGEITEKGYINQSRTQSLREDDVAILFAANGSECLMF